MHVEVRMHPRASIGRRLRGNHPPASAHPCPALCSHSAAGLGQHRHLHPPGARAGRGRRPLPTSTHCSTACSEYPGCGFRCTVQPCGCCAAAAVSAAAAHPLPPPPRLPPRPRPTCCSHLPFAYVGMYAPASTPSPHGELYGGARVADGHGGRGAAPVCVGKERASYAHAAGDAAAARAAGAGGGTSRPETAACGGAPAACTPASWPWLSCCVWALASVVAAPAAAAASAAVGVDRPPDHSSSCVPPVLVAPHTCEHSLPVCAGPRRKAAHIGGGRAVAGSGGGASWAASMNEMCM